MSNVNQDRVASIVKEILKHAGVTPLRIEAIREISNYYTTSVYASLKFEINEMNIVASNSLEESVIKQLKSFSTGILESSLVVNELQSLTKQIEQNNQEILKLKEEVERLTKFEQHFNVEKALRHNTELK